jgi:hypothetical protein
MTSERSRLDGRGDDDLVKLTAAEVLNHAINDEIKHRGAAGISETLACFIEFRIEELLRHINFDSDL